MSAQAAPAIFLRAKSGYRSCDKWGFRLTLALVVSSLTGVALGIDIASYLVLAIALPSTVFALRNPGVGLIGISVLVTLASVLGVTAFAASTPFPHNTLNYWLVLFCLLNPKLLFQLRQLQSKLHVLFLVVLAGGLLWSTSLYPTGILQVLPVVAGLGLILHFETLPPSQRRMLYWVAVSSSAVASVFGLLQFQDPAVTDRFDLNGVGSVQVTGLFAISLAVFSKVAERRELNLLMLLAAANLGFVFLSGSRGAMATALLTWLATIAWGFSPQRKLVYGAASLIMLLGLVSLFPELREYGIRRVEMTFDSSRSTTSISSGRSDLALIAWHLFRDHPIAGIGTGSYREAVTNFYHPDVVFFGSDRPAHSAWFQVLAENGLIGIVALLCYVASFAWTGFHRPRRAGLLAVGLIASGAITLRFATNILGSSLDAWWLAAGSIYLLSKPWPAPRRGIFLSARAHVTPSATSTSAVLRSAALIRPSGGLGQSAFRDEPDRACR